MASFGKMEVKVTHVVSPGSAKAVADEIVDRLKGFGQSWEWTFGLRKLDGLWDWELTLRGTKKGPKGE